MYLHQSVELIFKKRLAISSFRLWVAVILMLSSMGAKSADIILGIGCTFANAVDSSNTDTAVGGCSSGSGADQILLQGGSFSTAGTGAITSEVTIVGSAGILDLDGRMNVSAPGNLTATGLTIVNGVVDVRNNSTARFLDVVFNTNTRAIYSDAGSIELVDSVIQNFTGEGIVFFSGGNLQITRSLIVGRRPGLNIASNDGSFSNVTIEESQFFDNTGAIFLQSRSKLTIIGSDFYSNGTAISVSSIDPSPLELTELILEKNTIYDNGYGVSIRNAQSIDVTLTNNTFSNNTDGINCTNSNAVQMMLAHNTITTNDFGLYETGCADSNSLISLSANVISGNGKEVNLSGANYTSDNNLLGELSHTNSSAFFGFSPSASDVTATIDGNNPTVLESILDPILTDNGGETPTHALVPGSPAIDVLATGPDVDQRGSIRPAGLAYDIGSYEHEPVGYCNGLIVTVDINAGQNTTSGEDVVMGTPGPDDIRGKGGNDTICGKGGDDYIHGNSGNDWIDGGDDVDFLRGGQGNDSLFAGTGATVGHPSRVFGGYGDDSIYGGPDADDLRGGRGVDTIEGGGGDDSITGNEDDDVIFGDAGNDELKGGNGDNDILYGGIGDDSLNGGSGNNDICISGGDAGDTTQNCATPGPDLELRSLTVQQVTIDSIKYGYIVKNVGNESASLSGVIFGAYLSQDTVYNNADDIAAGEFNFTGTLAPGSTIGGSFTATVSMPPTGFAYLTAKVDASEILTELDETNNTVATALP